MRESSTLTSSSRLHLSVMQSGSHVTSEGLLPVPSRKQARKRSSTKSVKQSRKPAALERRRLLCSFVPCHYTHTCSVSSSSKDNTFILHHCKPCVVSGGSAFQKSHVVCTFVPCHSHLSGVFCLLNVRILF